MDGWNTTFLLGRSILRGYVKLRGVVVKSDRYSEILVRNWHETQKKLHDGIGAMRTGERERERERENE